MVRLERIEKDQNDFCNELVRRSGKSEQVEADYQNFMKEWRGASGTPSHSGSDSLSRPTSVKRIPRLSIKSLQQFVAKFRVLFKNDSENRV